MERGHDKIIMQGMEFYGYHGVLPAEQEIGQLFLVDLELATYLEHPGRLDDVSETIDYSEVYGLVEKIVTEERCNLIEGPGRADRPGGAEPLLGGRGDGAGEKAARSPGGQL